MRLVFVTDKVREWNLLAIILKLLLGTGNTSAIVLSGEHPERLDETLDEII